MNLYSTIQLTLEHIYVTFEGKPIIEKNNLQTAQDSPLCTPKIAIIFDHI